VGTPAPPLGTRLPATTTAVDVSFAAGDCCLLYTDGLVEAPNAAGESYGAARLAAVLAGQTSASGAPAICDAVLADLAAHRDGAAQQDDVTLVVVVGR
jgi:sigma-B regulation protein RsbU (phosphoserine phosphatase)